MSAILLSIFLSTAAICRCTSILGNVKLRFPISLGLIDGYDDTEADNDNPVDDGQGDDYDDGLFDSPDFEPIEITPISIGKTHATIEAATALINEKTFDDGEAKAP